jgi:hypothetical protein
MDERLGRELFKDDCRRRVPNILARVTGVILPGFNEHNADFTLTLGDLTAYHAPDGNVLVTGTTDPGKHALMRERVASAYAQDQQRVRNKRSRTQRPVHPQAMLALVHALIDLCDLDAPDAPWPHFSDKQALRIARTTCGNGSALSHSLVLITRKQRDLAKAVAYEACFDQAPPKKYT